MSIVSLLPCTYRTRILTSLFRWVALSFTLNLIWELIQLPLYTIAKVGGGLQVAYAVLHCTAGDALIAGASFLVVAFALRNGDWLETRPWIGGIYVIAFGLAYTGVSEWYNVYQAGNWAYAPAMPLVFGIGLAPLLQWLVLPVATLLIVRAWVRIHTYDAEGDMFVANSSSGNCRAFALPFHFECSVVVNAPAEAVFSRLDDPRLLSAHMSRSSWMMAGSRMVLELDASQGRAVGASIRMGGRVLGIALSLEEIVTERNPPRRKVWGTTGTPKLIVIGHYVMGYEVTPQGHSSLLRVFIDYALPEAPPGRWFGRVFGDFYARWCTQRLAGDAEEYFRTAGQSR